MARRFPLDRPYVITQGFGNTAYARSGAYGGGIHTGVDIAAAKGRTVYWPVPVRSVYQGWEPRGYGNYAVGRVDDRTEIWFGHFDSFGSGAIAGYVGTTGNSTGFHTHFEVRVNGKAIDPLVWLNEQGADMPYDEADLDVYRDAVNDQIYQKVLGRGIDEGAKVPRRKQTPGEVETDLYEDRSSNEYALRLRAELAPYPLTEEQLTQLIEGGRKSRVPVKVLATTFWRDRWKEAGAGKPDANVGKLKEIIKKAADEAAKIGG